MKRILPLLVFAVTLLCSCGASSETWTLEVSEHDPMKTSFTQKWHTTSVTVLYYPQATKWENAMMSAYAGDWQGAVNQWMNILKQTSSLERRSSAEYNIALGCYLLGQWKLADGWIKQCLADLGTAKPPYYVKRLNDAISRKVK